MSFWGAAASPSESPPYPIPALDVGVSVCSHSFFPSPLQLDQSLEPSKDSAEVCDDSTREDMGMLGIFSVLNIQIGTVGNVFPFSQNPPEL